MPLGLLAWGAAAGLGALHAEVETEAKSYIDPARVAVETSARFIDPRWTESLVSELLRLEPFASDDVAARAELRNVLLELPFLAEVSEPRLLWPDGAVVRVRFERPIACVRTGGVFHTVSDAGAVLPGAWVAPPDLDGIPLPLIGRIGRDEPVRVGGVLDREELWHALAVVLSMEQCLSPEERLALGRIAIDAEYAELGRVDDPGTVIYLEGRRAILFGRSPDIDAPGELAVELKWRHVCAAVERQARADLDWRAIDVRWDRFTVAPRQEPEEPPAPEPWRTPAERAALQRSADRAPDGGSNRAVRGAPLFAPESANRVALPDVPRVR